MKGATTSQPEKRALVAGESPPSTERLTRYSIFITDAFANNTVSMTFLDTKAIPAQIDGFENDDSYRQSRHLLKKAEAGDSQYITNNLRENSLARQIATKQDQPATIRLIRRLKHSEFANETDADQRKPWRNLIPPNTKFFLEQVQENREEKVQVIDTFGEWIAFFFGRRPEVYSYSGTLLNTSNHDWKNEFQENYDNFLRGSQAVENRATVLLQYDDVLVEGYMMNCAISQTAMSNNAVPFSFSILVINRSPVNARMIAYLRYKRSKGTEAEQLLYENMTAALDLTKKGRIDELETFLIMREFFAGNYRPGAGTFSYSEEYGELESTTTTKKGKRGGINTEVEKWTPFTGRYTGSFEDALAVAELE